MSSVYSCLYGSFIRKNKQSLFIYITFALNFFFFFFFHLQDVSEKVTISGYHDVPHNNEDSFLKALANQPISVAIDASGRDFQFYSGVIN